MIMTESLMLRRRRRRRLLRGILSPLSYVLCYTLLLTVVSVMFFSMTASAEMRIPDPARGLVTDGDGIISESLTDNAESGILPELSEGLSEMVDDTGEGSLLPNESNGRPGKETTQQSGSKPGLPEMTTENVIMPAQAGGLWIVVLILFLLAFVAVTLVVLWSKRR